VDRSLPALRQAAETLFPIRGAWAYNSWAAINQRFFNNQLTPGSILWGLTAGCNFGSFNPNNNCITLHEALPGRDFAKQAKAHGESDWVMANRDQHLASWNLNPDSFGIGTALGTLLHEAMHQAHCQQGLRYGANGHHNTIWLAECQRVAVMIGLPDRIWPLYKQRKETADEVRTRIGAAADNLTGKQLNNRRQSIWVPTIDGQEVELELGDQGLTYQGQLAADTSEITGFPRQSYKRHEIEVADRVGLILP
jgi:hypothetical protein